MAQHVYVSLQQRVCRAHYHRCTTWRLKLTWAAHKLGQEVGVHSLGRQ